MFADFDFLEFPEKVGTISYDHVRGCDHFAFEYSREWLSRHDSIPLSGDLSFTSGVQYPESKGVFAFVKDAFPDRWGRTLFEMHEDILSKEEERAPRKVGPYDYLTGIDDFSRMGGIRYKNGRDDSFVTSNDGTLTPKIDHLGNLLEASMGIEMAKEKKSSPQQRHLDLLFSPGSSLGGARPKANVVDSDGKLYVAKFPSRKDLENTELLEHFAHLLAKRAGIDVAKTKLARLSKDRDILLSERFDRNSEGKRIHFASAMALLGLEDGCGADTGNGYLDIVDFIVKNCTDVQRNLVELYRRVAFNILFGNTDDHFRNHGFLLREKGWTLAPAYDINPSEGRNQCLLINEYTEQSDMEALRRSCESYMLDRKDANEIISEVTDAVRDWQSVAKKNQISPKVLGKYSDRWSSCQK